METFTHVIVLPPDFNLLITEQGSRQRKLLLKRYDAKIEFLTRYISIPSIPSCQLPPVATSPHRL